MAVEELRDFDPAFRKLEGDLRDVEARSGEFLERCREDFSREQRDELAEQAEQLNIHIERCRQTTAAGDWGVLGIQTEYQRIQKTVSGQTLETLQQIRGLRWQILKLKYGFFGACWHVVTKPFVSWFQSRRKARDADQS